MEIHLWHLEVLVVWLILVYFELCTISKRLKKLTKEKEHAQKETI